MFRASAYGMEGHWPQQAIWFSREQRMVALSPTVQTAERSCGRLQSEPGVIVAPVTYQVEGVQYVSVMAGWGGRFL